MKIGMVAYHYPHPAYRDEFISRVHQVREVMLRTPGCLSGECWVSGDAVISIVQWESEEARIASLAAVDEAGVDVTYDERESRPRTVVPLQAA
ncbi:antibiotic biosynthesis monooxygenase family protein [Streptomyces palmae]|uniref:ABM domain-containing protein n=1 Tax=Streptomyces palmae TaxID=1701085 RepID=A0A4Z0HG64_9ACTN|nr:antibiotic biosynthesis monooxygenase [Streptomyces palmae]TGB19629.1 hypothetical protein E4099_00355 [Streptomyces palmae]